MYTASRQGINAYARVGLETGVIAASPHRLILMLFEGARVALSSALVHMRIGETVAKGESLSKAISIISSGLQASLDVNAGGELAQAFGVAAREVDCPSGAERPTVDRHTKPFCGSAGCSRKYLPGTGCRYAIDRAGHVHPRSCYGTGAQ